MTALIHAQQLYPYWLTNFATMQTFYKDVAAGTLPTCAFIEPRMIFNNSDYHPPAPSFTHDGITIGGISDVRAGDLSTVHHGAFARTLCTKYNLPHLTERDRTAPDLADALNLTTPRTASTWPVTVPRPVPPELSGTPSLGGAISR